MPIGNGAPRGLSAATLGVYSDPRTYDTVHTAAGDTGFDQITKPASLSPYKKVIAATPGLAMWWPLNKIGTVYNGGLTTGYLNAAGGTTLATSGTVANAAGLIPGDRNGSAHLTSAHLDAYDYRVWPMCDETMMSVEFWINFDSISNDVGLVGEWGSSVGWTIIQVNGDLRMYVGPNFLAATGVFATGKTYHVVGVYGGNQSPTGDFLSRLYVNGTSVQSGNLVATGSTVTVNTSVPFQIGQYANSGGTSSLSGRIQDVAIYNRMLQPAEVRQHYAAGFARG